MRETWLFLPVALSVMLSLADVDHWFNCDLWFCFRAKERADHAQRMSVPKPGGISKKRHRLALHPSHPPSKKVRSALSSKHTPMEKAFEQPTGQPKKIEFKLTEAISNIFDSGAALEMPGKSRHCQFWYSFDQNRNSGYSLLYSLYHIG